MEPHLTRVLFNEKLCLINTSVKFRQYTVCMFDAHLKVFFPKLKVF